LAAASKSSGVGETPLTKYRILTGFMFEIPLKFD